MAGKTGRRRTVESCFSFDIRSLQLEDALVPGFTGTMKLTNGRRVAMISLEAEISYIKIAYRCLTSKDEGEDISEAVYLARMPCPFGGERFYFLCPGCQQRVKRLFEHDRRFRCLHCHHLAYASEFEPAHERLTARAQALRQRLDKNSRWDSTPKRPKWMHRKTYDRLCAKLAWTENESDLSFMLSQGCGLDEIYGPRAIPRETKVSPG